LFDQALGLFETRGLALAIVALDAMLKTAHVQLISKQKIQAGIVTTIIQGDVASVRTALEAGEEVAKKHSGPEDYFRSKLMIASPWEDTLNWIGDLQTTSKFTAPTAPQNSPKTPSKSSYSNTLTNLPLNPEHRENFTVAQLRQCARSLFDFPIKGRAISHAGKKELLQFLNDYYDNKKTSPSTPDEDPTSL
jgi:microcompartment protein CcmL/EutN